MKNIIGKLVLLWLLMFPSVLFSRLFRLNWYHTMLEQWLAPLQKNGAKVLEVACASGDLSRVLATRGMEVWAVDRAASMISRAQKNQAQSFLSRLM
jgi:2-polyprenyl-3-methyl-5-hydroxy-6-metoxy-1,4-benzoquinol methylase